MAEAKPEAFQDGKLGSQKGLPEAVDKTGGQIESLRIRMTGGHRPSGHGRIMQGVVKSYDPGTREGVIMRDTDRSEYDLSETALEGSVFRMLRQGQRVVFDLDDAGRATAIRLGSEVDMGTPGFPKR